MKVELKSFNLCSFQNFDPRPSLSPPPCPLFPLARLGFWAQAWKTNVKQSDFRLNNQPIISKLMINNDDEKFIGQRFAQLLVLCKYLQHKNWVYISRPVETSGTLERLAEFLNEPLGRYKIFITLTPTIDKVWV